MLIPRPRVRELVWPSIPDQTGAFLLAVQYQLEQTQWWPAEALLSLQMRQLEILLQHASKTVPYYREQLQAARIDVSKPLTMETWRSIPLLARETIQHRGSELLSTDLPKEHGGTFEKKTSGSTGLQMTITDTEANNLYWMAITLRDHLWHRRHFGGGLVAIRSGRSEKDPFAIMHFDSWGQATGSVYQTGPSTVFYHLLPIRNQAELLLELQPEYLLIYPSNAMLLADYFRANNLTLPSLRGVITYGELLQPEVRQDCLDVWQVPVNDMYSCEELGYIALQCPEFEHYHCQSESVLVEVLRDDGEPCGPGESGRVVLTSLHNFAMPLIRYENLDYAEVGQPCPCGRGAPVLKRLLGRERNRALGVDGKKFWPNFSRRTWSAIGGIEELQLVQVAADHLEVRLVSRQPLASEQEQQLSDLLRAALAQPYSFSFQHQQEILRHANGKYERFIRNIDG